jgi:predicted  nucleic acid-binding Zn-ribbon protein
MPTATKEKDIFKTIEHVRRLVTDKNVDAEEVCEFLDTIHSQAERLQDDLNDAETELEETKDKLIKKTEDFNDLQSDFDKLEDETDLIDDIRTLNGKENLRYSTDNEMDREVMTELARCYETMNYRQICELLKTGYEILY